MICTFDKVNVTLNEKEILKDLNWQIPKGKVIGLLGKNGAGKTTLIRTMVGLIIPNQGQVTTLGINARDMDDSEKQKLAYVPQNVSSYHKLTVEKAIEIHSHCYANWDRELSNRMIIQLKIPLARHVDKLSLGQYKSFLTLLALSSRPELLIMDEPVAGLDPSARRETLKFITETANRNCSILYSTHITDDIYRLTDKVALLSDKQIQLFENTETIAQTVLLKGSFSSSYLSQAPFHNRIIKSNQKQAIISNWQKYDDQYLSSDTTKLPLNLEEFFIQWHNFD